MLEPQSSFASPARIWSVRISPARTVGARRISIPRWTALVALAASLVALFGSTPAARAAEPPRLTVLISVDQMRQDYLTRLLPHLPDGGFKRLVADGANFTDAHYEYCSTFTGPGHAVQATGTYGYRNGYVNNSYYDRKAGKVVGPAEDPATTLVGVPEKTVGVSPRKLLAGTLGDRLIMETGGQARVVALTLKDRASVPLAGHQGKAYWFEKQWGRFATSSYYGETLPRWLADANASGRVDADFGKPWTRRGPAAAYAMATADDASWEDDDLGLGRTFPRKLVGSKNTRDKSYYTAWAMSPYAVHMLVDLAKAAIIEEQLGADAVPDFFAFGLTPTDYVGHTFGPYSHEAISIFFETDAAIAALLKFLDQRIGRGRYVVALTADHGAPPVPEHSAAMGRRAGRVAKKDVLGRIEAALSRRFGRPAGGSWIAGHKPPFIALNHKAVTRAKVDLETAQAVAAESVAGLDGIEAVYIRERVLEGRYAPSPLTTMVTRCFHPERSGDLYVLTKPYWLWSSWDTHPHGTSHGTPYSYDTHVPLIIAGPGVRPGTYRRRVQLIDLAPTLAALMGSQPPDRSEGHILFDGMTP